MPQGKYSSLWLFNRMCTNIISFKMYCIMHGSSRPHQFLFLTIFLLLHFLIGEWLYTELVFIMKTDSLAQKGCSGISKQSKVIFSKLILLSMASLPCNKKIFLYISNPSLTTWINLLAIWPLEENAHLFYCCLLLFVWCCLLVWFCVYRVSIGYSRLQLR